ncbi:MAG: holo-ACP synthase [Planctomycetaceae bacterium]|jgi:holo-[acyl-carrier protein] synthase|nr:holo-ACP synthase [Planctomycetaceae bacterium]
MQTIGIGTDITECGRVERMLKRHGEMFTARVFTSKEIDYCDNRKQAVQHYTGRWAGKEAVLKALGTGWIAGISWKDIEILNEAGGKPRVQLTGGALKVSRELGIDEILISISHCHSHAVAFAVAVGKDI